MSATAEEIIQAAGNPIYSLADEAALVRMIDENDSICVLKEVSDHFRDAKKVTKYIESTKTWSRKRKIELFIFWLRAELQQPGVNVPQLELESNLAILKYFGNRTDLVYLWHHLPSVGDLANTTEKAQLLAALYKFLKIWIAKIDSYHSIDLELALQNGAFDPFAMQTA